MEKAVFVLLSKFQPWDAVQISSLFKLCWNMWSSGGRFKNAYELLNLRALKISMLYKNPIFQCMG